MKSLSEISPHMSCLVADSINSCSFFSIFHQWQSLHFAGGKNMHHIRQRDIGTPGLFRIVISMYYKSFNAIFSRTVQFTGKGHLRCQTMMITIIYITGNQNSIYPVIDRSIHNLLKCLKGRFADLFIPWTTAAKAYISKWFA